MTIRILLDHGVQEDHIIFLTILVARVGGIGVIRRAFPKVRIITGTIDDEVRETWREEGGHGRKDWQILPGLGDIGKSIPLYSYADSSEPNPRRSLFLNRQLHHLFGRRVTIFAPTSLPFFPFLLGMSIARFVKYNPFPLFVMVPFIDNASLALESLSFRIVSYKASNKEPIGAIFR